MILELPVSIGEALDKLTILDIKLSKIQDGRRIDVQKEYDILYEKLKDFITKYESFYKILRQINLTIWEYQDFVRGKDLAKDEKHIKYCLDILDENDRRFRVKNKINNLANSTLKEQKGYPPKKAVFFGHIGLGDMINMSGAVRYLSTIYDEVTVICPDYYINNMKMLYRDDPTISLHPIKGAIDAPPLYNLPIEELKQLVTGSYFIPNGNVTGVYPDSIPLGFYDQLGIPRSVYRDYFFLDKNIPESIELYKPFEGKKYIFVHQNTSRGDVNIDTTVDEDTITLNISKNIYPEEHQYHTLADIVINKPLFHYVHLIENATELHLSDSCFSCLANLLDISKSKRKVCYSRSGHKCDNMDGWEYIL